MNSGETFTGEQDQGESDSAWDTLTGGEKTWADEFKEKKARKKEAIDSYRAASEVFRLDFNERATGPEQFEEWIAAEEDGISEEEVDFEDKKIKVYHLTGHRFLCLVHCINYRNAADAIVYPETYKRSMAIQDDPSNWGTTPVSNNPKNENTGRRKTGFANNISTSLVSDKVPNGSWIDGRKAIYYGFSNIGLRGVITASYRDTHTQQGWTSKVQDEDFHSVTPTGYVSPAMQPGWTDDAHGEGSGEWRTIQTIDTIESFDTCNEVAIDRYEEDSGRPIMPAFIYCPNTTGTVEDLTEAQMRHAAFFGIPIVIMHRDAYEE